jgi:hypothetical protein
MAVVEVSEIMERHCLRLRVSGNLEQGLVTRGSRIEAGTLLALGRNGSLKWCYSTNTFEFDCMDDKVSPAELDIPHTWIRGSADLI